VGQKLLTVSLACSMRILIYSQFCTPEPIFKSVPFARELTDRGHEVRIVTGFPNYPGGKIYDSYKIRIWQKEEIEGIPILRTPLFPSHDSSAVRRLINYSTFAATSSVPLLCGWKPDVVYVYTLVSLSLVASVARVLRGVPSVVDVQDIWPDSLFQAGMAAGWMKPALNWFCNAAYKGATQLVTSSPGMAQLLMARNRPPRPVEVIYNWCDERQLLTSETSGESALEFQSGRWFNVVFAGNIGMVQGLQHVIEAAAKAYKINPRIRFVFMGTGVALEELKMKAAQRAPHNTLFLPSRPIREAGAILRQADALLIHLQKASLFEITIPGKTQAYLALGKPIVMAVKGDAADLVKRAGAGVVVEPESPDCLAEAVSRLAALPTDSLTAMGNNGMKFYHRELSLKIGVSKFEDLFDRVVTEKRQRTSASRK